jgi:hypothetical protein
MLLLGDGIMNINFFKLSALLGVFLLSSIFPAMAMDRDDQKVSLSSLPRFPLNADGQDIEQKNFSISGIDLKSVLRDSRSLRMREILSDEWIYRSYGVYGKNLMSYYKIDDSKLYELRYSDRIPNPFGLLDNTVAFFNGWTLEGTFSDRLEKSKKFKVIIEQEEYMG